jgi:flagellar hook-basal body complex protein FliE
MPIASLTPLAPLPRLAPLAPPPTDAQPVGGSGFGTLLNNLLENNSRANVAANDAIRDLATGEAQDLHTVALTMAQADLSFRIIMELRNRLSDALQEVTRMQV